MTCPYQGYEFGARYVDSVCIDRMLWDADSDDGEGNLCFGGEDPCPLCNMDYAIERAAASYEGDSRFPFFRGWQDVRDARARFAKDQLAWGLKNPDPAKTPPFVVCLARHLRHRFTIRWQSRWLPRLKRAFGGARG